MSTVTNDRTAEYARFKWLIPGQLAGAPHPDLSDGLAAVAPFLRTESIGAIVTLYDKPLVILAEVREKSSM